MAPKGEWQPKNAAAEEKGAGKGKKGKAEKGGGKGEKAAAKPEKGAGKGKAEKGGEKAAGKASGKGEKASGKGEKGQKGKESQKGGKGKGKPQKEVEEEEVPKQQKGKANKGAGKGKEEQKGGGKRSQKKEQGGDGGGEWDASRSQLSSNAPDFQPSGAYGYGGGYDESMYWNWPGMQPEPQSLWKEYADVDGVPYYYNFKTGLCQWEKPAELEPPKLTPLVSPESMEKAKLTSLLAEPKSEKDKPDKRQDRRDGGRDGGGRGDKDDRNQGKGGKKRQPKKEADKEASDFGPPGCNLFVFHLPDDWNDEDLHEYFAPHGNVVSAKVMKELGTGRSRGFGFVSYEDRVSAATAIKKMQGYKILGKRLKVEFKKGEGEDEKLDDEDGAGKKSYPDDERLIGYLRAISAKNVVQSLKESEDGAGEGGGAEAPEADD